MTRGRHVALTIDLDGPEQYRGLHGLADEGGDPLALLRAPLQRFVALCDELGGAGTLFVIGRDLERGAADLLQPLAARGFEVASHSYAHDYHMSEWDAAKAREDLARSVTLMKARLGGAPRGFRAPGYHLSGAMLDALEDLGFVYTSSVLASPAYYAVKAGVLGTYRMLGRRSSSLLGSPAMGLAPSQPYRPGVTPYRPGSRRLWELPLAVTRWARLPVTAASIVLAPAPLRARMITSIAAADVVVINMHAIDFADRAEVDARLRRRQPELERSLDERLSVLGETCRALAADHDARTCAAIVDRLAATGTPSAG